MYLDMFLYRCINCGSEFSVAPSRHRRALEDPLNFTPKYCGMACLKEYKKLHVKPNSGSFKIGENTGEKNINWKGGRIKLVEQIRKLPQYKVWRTAIFTRDNYTCIKCRARSRTGVRVVLNADHHPLMFYQILDKYNIDSIEKALACEQLWDVDGGQTLCTDCHRKKTNKDLGIMPKNVSGMVAYNKARAKRILSCHRESCDNTWVVKLGHYNQKYCSKACAAIVVGKLNTGRKIKGHLNSTGFRGVKAKGNRFRAFIQHNGKQIHIGMFKTAVEAHKAYEQKALELSST
jgi:5-methylcytosine-specific restriction endonuclease McrA